MTPALFTRMSNGPVHERTKLATEAGSARSSGATRTAAVPGGRSAPILSATLVPASTLRTARVNSAPAEPSARAASMPIPELAPVTMTRCPCRFSPLTISAAVVVGPYVRFDMANSLMEYWLEPAGRSFRRDQDAPTHAGYPGHVIGGKPRVTLTRLRP